MLDHVGLRTKKLEALVKFYETALKPLGYAKLAAYDGAAGFGKGEAPQLWITSSKEAPSSVHVALESPTRKAVDALLYLLSDPSRRIMTVDELRRTIEALPPTDYARLGYYEKWMTAIAAILVEKGVLSRGDIDAKVAALRAGG